MRTLASVAVVSLLLGLPAASRAAAPAPGVPANGGVKVPGPWVALHVLNYETDADLAALEQQLPALAARGVNVLVLEVDYAFESLALGMPSVLGHLFTTWSKQPNVADWPPLAANASLVRQLAGGKGR
mgnify:CR=1 FL=1